jgi:hypothetical protein
MPRISITETIEGGVHWSSISLLSCIHCSFRTTFLHVRRFAMGGDQEQDVLMCRDIWAFDIVALTCSALLRPLLCKTRFFAYSACSLAHQRCWKLTGQFECPRWGGNTASIAPDFTAALHFTYCCFLRFACTFLSIMFFLSLHKKWRTDLSLLQRHILDSKYGRVELFRLD